jgi:hypothetical protein
MDEVMCVDLMSGFPFSSRNQVAEPRPMLLSVFRRRVRAAGGESAMDKNCPQHTKLPEKYKHILRQGEGASRQMRVLFLRLLTRMPLGENLMKTTRKVR